MRSTPLSKAVSFAEYGGPEVLDVIEVAEPHAGAGEVRVAVRAAGVNPFDSKMRNRQLFPSHTLPAGQGTEFSGVVDEVGDGVVEWKLGDEVLGWISRGAQAEYVVVPQAQLAAKPAALDWAVAGGIGLVANTARRIVDSLAITPADTVLVTGAAGGVGMMASQMALAAGASVVGTASETNHPFLRSIGVIPVAYDRHGDASSASTSSEIDRLREAAPGGYTVAIDTVGGEAIDRALELGISPSRINTLDDNAPVEELGIQKVGGGKKNSAELAEFAQHAADGKLVLPIRGSYHLDEVAAAYRDLDGGHGLGKVVLLIP
jgi:NADPH:quinone reductase-like Zn-dependent oxidoreductase